MQPVFFSIRSTGSSVSFSVSVLDTVILRLPAFEGEEVLPLKQLLYQINEIALKKFDETYAEVNYNLSLLTTFVLLPSSSQLEDKPEVRRERADPNRSRMEDREGPRRRFRLDSSSRSIISIAYIPRGSRATHRGAPPLGQSEVPALNRPIGASIGFSQRQPSATRRAGGAAGGRPPEPLGRVKVNQRALRPRGDHGTASP